MNNRNNRSTSGRLLGKAELQAYLNLGLRSSHNFAETAGAVVRIGNRVLYDRNKIDAYIDAEIEKQYNK